MRGLALTSSPILLPLGLIVHGSSVGSSQRSRPTVQHMFLSVLLSACLHVSHIMVATLHGHTLQELNPAVAQGEVNHTSIEPRLLSNAAAVQVYILGCHSVHGLTVCWMLGLVKT